VIVETRGQHAPERNAILRALPEDDRAALVSASQLIQFGPRQHLDSKVGDGHSVYFPLEGVISVIIELPSGGTIDTTIVGADGIAGIPPFVDLTNIGIRLAGQLRGSAYALSSTTFYDHLESSPGLAKLLIRYSGYMIGALSMTIACTRFHAAEQQYARWLLAFHDYAGQECFPMTQDLLGGVLGVRRATITSVAQQFRDAGVIDSRRGEICVRDRAGLESMACECYETLKASYRQIFPMLA
jgi:CRP-like cAMP-binding protein